MGFHATYDKYVLRRRNRIGSGGFYHHSCMQKCNFVPTYNSLDIFVYRLGDEGMELWDATSTSLAHHSKDLDVLVSHLDLRT